MSTPKEQEDFQLQLVDRFLEAAVEDIAEMRRVIKNLALFDETTAARLVVRTLLSQEVSSLITGLSQLLGGLVRLNTQDTLILVDIERVKAESDELLAAFKSGIVPSDKKDSAN